MHVLLINLPILMYLNIILVNPPKKIRIKYVAHIKFSLFIIYAQCLVSGIVTKKL